MSKKKNAIVEDAGILSEDLNAEEVTLMNDGNPEAEPEAEPSDTDTSPVNNTPTDETEKVLYVGPTIIGVAVHGTIYDRVPPAAESVAADLPDIVNLFVAVTDYAMAEGMIRRKEGYVYPAYKRAADFVAAQNRRVM